MTARRYIATFTVLAFVAGFVNDDRDIVVFLLDSACDFCRRFSFVLFVNKSKEVNA